VAPREGGHAAVGAQRPESSIAAQPTQRKREEGVGPARGGTTGVVTHSSSLLCSPPLAYNSLLPEGIERTKKGRSRPPEVGARPRHSETLCAAASTQPSWLRRMEQERWRCADVGPVAPSAEKNLGRRAVEPEAVVLPAHRARFGSSVSR
jgi:hypothetical protein